MQVIEKAYKKLRLDALVIQQGRLTQNSTKVGKDDLLSMVKYGAERVFSSEPTKITDEDVDAIIAKGESDTVRCHLVRGRCDACHRLRAGAPLSDADLGVGASDMQFARH